MRKHFPKIVWQVIKFTGLFYVIGGILLYFFQHFLLFQPVKLPSSHTFSFHCRFKEENITAGNRNINLVKFFSDTPRKGIVLYFHGNRQNIERYAPYAPYFTRNGYDVWMMDYPGYGKSTGKLSEENLYADALLLYNMAVQETVGSSIVLYGKSLGTGIAAQLASIKEARRLILETPYFSMSSLFSHYAPFYPNLNKYKLPTYAYLSKANMPVTILHGTADKVIPYTQAVKLNRLLPKEVTLVTFKWGTHNNLPSFPLYHHVIDSLLKYETRF